MNHNQFLGDIVNRMVNCTNRSCLYTNVDSEATKYIYPGIRVERYLSLAKREDAFFYFDYQGVEDIQPIDQILQDGKQDLLVNIEEPDRLSNEKRKQWADYMRPTQYGGYVLFSGRHFNIENSKCLNKVKVLTIIHCYNEIDILADTLEYLLNQGVDIYLIDNWSNDGSYEVAVSYAKKYPGRFFLERFPGTGATSDFMWFDQLQKTEEISLSTDYDWYIHYDVDEIRIPPWKGVSIQEALSYIDYLGYNGVENTVIDFRMTDEKDSIYPDGPYFDFRHKPYWINHLKTWKRTSFVDLKSTGGHRAKYENPKIFPLRFINKHYPLRSVKQASKKVFSDRKPRFKAERDKRGWHGHYDLINEKEDFIFDKQRLYKWDETTLEKLYFELVMEAGIVWEEEEGGWALPEISGERIVLYGAGKAGRYAYLQMIKNNIIEAWVDRDYKYYPHIYAAQIDPIERVRDFPGSKVVVSVINVMAQKCIGEYLNEIGVKSDNIYYVKDK